VKRQTLTRRFRPLVALVAVTLAGCLDPVGDIFPGITSIGGPTWFPDGERIVFYLKGEDVGSGGYYVVDADGGGLRRWRDLGPDNPDRQIAHELLKVARAGERAGVAKLRRIGVRTTGRWPGGAPKDLVFSVAWSPDRQRIAYSYRSPGRTGQDVYVVRTDGSSKPRLVARHADGPTWSPDGRLIGVSRGIYGMFVVPVAGGRPRKLPIELDPEPGVWRSALGSPVWSPDGTQIAFSTSYGLYVADVDTGRTRRLADIGDA